MEGSHTYHTADLELRDFTVFALQCDCTLSGRGGVENFSFMHLCMPTCIGGLIDMASNAEDFFKFYFILFFNLSSWKPKLTLMNAHRNLIRVILSCVCTAVSVSTVQCGGVGGLVRCKEESGDKARRLEWEWHYFRLPPSSLPPSPN